MSLDGHCLSGVHDKALVGPICCNAVTQTVRKTDRTHTHCLSVSCKESLFIAYVEAGSSVQYKLLHLPGLEFQFGGQAAYPTFPLSKNPFLNASVFFFIVLKF